MWGYRPCDDDHAMGNGWIRRSWTRAKDFIITRAGKGSPRLGHGIVKWALKQISEFIKTPSDRSQVMRALYRLSISSSAARHAVENIKISEL